MEYRLSSVGTLVEHQPITFGGDAFPLSDLDSHGDEMARNLLVRAIDLGWTDDVLAGYDQDVHGCLRPDVTEGQSVLIFIDNIGGLLASDDLAENTAHSDLSLQSSSLRHRDGFGAERAPGNTSQTDRRDGVGQHGGRLHLNSQIVVSQAGVEEPGF